MKKRDDIDYYRTLNVPRNASAKDIKDAFRRRARETHPDTNPEATGEEFSQVNLAWETLGNKKSRYLYDMTNKNAGLDPTLEKPLSPRDLGEYLRKNKVWREALNLDPDELVEKSSGESKA